MPEWKLWLTRKAFVVHEPPASSEKMFELVLVGLSQNAFLDPMFANAKTEPVTIMC